MRKFINKVLTHFDAEIVRKSLHQKLVQKQKQYATYEMVDLIGKENRAEYFANIPNSLSQIFQDFFALSVANFKKDGFFVEFGATNGCHLSNTWLLEKHFGWGGILAEPAKKWHSDLCANRSATIELDCVWSATGETLRFNEADEGELSTIDVFSKGDQHSAARQNGAIYDVQTISLLDLLQKHSAPKLIDYLSIDTEGSEFEILNAFDFNKYQFKCITVEHNFTPMRERIYDLLSQNGYSRVFSEFSRFDDWYTLRSETAI